MAPRILMIDDEEKIVKAMTTLLTAEGYEVFSTTEPKDFYKIISTPQRIDVIILDLDMPLLTGLDIIKGFKQILAYKKIPIIVYSGAFTQGNEDLFFDAIEQRPYKVISKGDLKKLLETIKKALGESVQRKTLNEQERDELNKLESLYRQVEQDMNDPQYLRYLELYNLNGGDSELAESYRKQREKLEK